METRYVCVKRFAELTGYSEKAVEHKRRNGVWREGREYKIAPDNRILINLEGYEKWVEAGPARA
jgi:hypothetical protein